MTKSRVQQSNNFGNEQILEIVGQASITDSVSILSATDFKIYRCNHQWPRNRCPNKVDNTEHYCWTERLTDTIASDDVFSWPKDDALLSEYETNTEYVNMQFCAVAPSRTNRFGHGPTSVRYVK